MGAIYPSRATTHFTPPNYRSLNGRGQRTTGEMDYIFWLVIRTGSARTPSHGLPARAAPYLWYVSTPLLSNADAGPQFSRHSVRWFVDVRPLTDLEVVAAGVGQPPPSGGEYKIGGKGGIAFGLDIKGLEKSVSINDDSKDDLPALSPAEFCQEYGLGDDIRNLLIKHRYDPIYSLLEVNESKLKSLGFKIGHIAELRWALKKMILKKYGAMPVGSEEGKHVYVPEICGGIGGAGGVGGRKGGDGGAGRAPQIEMEDLFRFRDIRGGIGGAGGRISGAGGSGGMLGVAGLSEKAALAATGEAIARGGANIYGGTGGSGGSGIDEGGSGGLGKAARMLAWQVAFFNKITGGTGGAGGDALIQGGRGGVGEGNKFPKLLWSIDNETRSWLLPTKLQDFKIRPDLRQLLEEQGFHSVGGLFEAYDTDLLEAQDDPDQQSPFAEGDVPVLTGALRKFVKEQKKKREENRQISS